MFPKVKLCGVSTMVFAALALSANAQQSSNKVTSTLLMPPEYVKCSEVPQKLAEVDALMRKFNRHSSSKEAQFWMNRQERLIARSYVCQE